jgi:hypothetical protein
MPGSRRSQPTNEPKEFEFTAPEAVKPDKLLLTVRTNNQQLALYRTPEAFLRLVRLAGLN